ncbi:hypothetical protein BVJ53_12400 [Lacticaseibacillus chiayiensis]|uniref:Uncharacterized protein n=1 Tax=Lacticaseibacillus chiayiensis TaxID=2100821 RepID=A0A4Q1TKE3_9LACO|nr:hypothetical protein BVJ53_12400 [Lacticaseibacillus chiayiensis]RXT59476.1 hypothetical protein CHT97_00595 [Lacticaseibacillus chiayiensis]
MRKHSRHDEGLWLDIICCLSLWLAVACLLLAALAIKVNRPYIIITLAFGLCAFGETVTVFKKW